MTPSTAGMSACTIALPTRTTSYPTYLAEEVSPKLPLLTGFAVLALVEVRPREDAAESQSEALLAHALGRLVRTAR
jgi:hypothetical protein